MSSPRGSISPATDTARKLENLSSSTGAIIDAFNEIIALPYVASLKTDEGGLTSVSDLALQLKENYQSLQGETLPFARDLYSYAALQISAIPLINNGGLSLQNYILLNKSVVARKKTNATRIKQLSENYRKQFVVAVETLNETLGNLNKQIKDLRKEIEKQKDAYDEAVVGAIFGAILAGLFTALFIAGLFATGGALAGAGAVAANGYIVAMGASLATAAGTSGIIGVTGAVGLGAASALVTTIVKSVEAGNILGAIHSLETAVQSAETTKNDLEEVIQKMQVVEDKLDDIVDIWTEVEDSLDLVSGDLTAWEAPGYFTAEKGDETVQEWVLVQNAVSKYTNIVSSRSVVPTMFASRDTHANVSNTDIDTPMFLRNVGIMALSDLKVSLIAPRVELEGQLSDMNGATQVLMRVVAHQLLQEDQKLISNARSCMALLDSAQGSVRMSCSRLDSMCSYSFSLFEKLAEHDAEQLAGEPNAVRRALEDQIAVVDSQHEKASDEMSKSEQAVFSFQHSFSVLQSSLERAYGEKMAQKSVLEKRLNDIERERRDRKYLWLIPLAGAINELVDLANNIQGKINRLRGEVRELDALSKAAKSSSAAVLLSSKQTTAMSQAFSEILNKNEEIRTSLGFIEQLQLETPASFFHDVAKSWDGLHDELTWFSR